MSPTEDSRARRVGEKAHKFGDRACAYGKQNQDGRAGRRSLSQLM
jgi:hypothetical protein